MDDIDSHDDIDYHIDYGIEVTSVGSFIEKIKE